MTKKCSFPTEDEVRTKAYQIYLEHGCQSGHDLDDWLQAEYELIQLPLRKITDLEVVAIEKDEAKQLRLLHLARAALTSTKQVNELLYPAWLPSPTSNTAGISTAA